MIQTRDKSMNSFIDEVLMLDSTIVDFIEDMLVHKYAVHWIGGFANLSLLINMVS